MTSAPSGVESARAQVEALRKKLLDLTLRNQMLNHRLSRRLGLRVLDEDAVLVHQMLVEEGRKLSFVGKKDPPAKPDASRELPGLDDQVALAEFREAAEEELDAFLTSGPLPVNQTDTKLNTDELESVLQAKLRTIHREANLANDELGINTLFLALGALEWRETPERSFRAPLLFVPVKIEMQANGSTRLVHDGGDVGINLPLKAKLAEFGMKLPELDEEKTLFDYFSEVESTVRRREDWQVHRNEIVLGFFNYEKYSMYVDLGGEGWPDDRKPWTAPDILAMLTSGYPEADSQIGEETLLDEYRPVEQSHEVYDADSSQTLAMIRAGTGLSIVVEGPPGTGKSQTITNIIAEAVANGKTVLFVSEKRAALEVVKRRLEEADLGGMCLDLHDKLTNRREFYAEIKRTVSRSLSIKDEEGRIARLGDLRDRLNRHSRAVNEVLPEFGCTPFRAMSRLAQLPSETAEDRDGRVPFEEIRGWTEEQMEARLPHVRAIQRRLDATGVQVEHPYWGCAIDYLDPAIRLDLQEELSAAIPAVTKALEAQRAAAEALRVEVPLTANNVRVLRVCADRATTAPPHDGVALQVSSWQAEQSVVRETIEALRTINSIRASSSAHVQESIWAADLTAVSAAFEANAERWYKFLIGEYRAARRTLEGYLSPSAPTEPVARRDLVRDIRTVQAAEAKARTNDEAMRRLFGVQWQGLSTDPEVLDRLLGWVLALRSDVETGRVPVGLLQFFSGETQSDPSALVQEAERLAKDAMGAYVKAAEILKHQTVSAGDEEWGALLERLNSWQSSMHRLPEFIALNEARRQALEQGMQPIVSLADRWPLAAERLETAFLRSYYSGIVRHAIQSRPELKSFERKTHEAMIDEFRDLDNFKLRYNRARVRLAHHRRLPTFETAVGNLQLLKIQCELQRKHKPIRWIMARAGAAIQQIKPVFMMSPLSVAIHLPPELPPFDLVIFDEASQVKPEDALCAIARAKQTIVVGDTRQMPPTSFFDRIVDDEDIEDEELGEEAELGQEARKLESVLSLMSAVVTGRARRPDLRWHYRSVHPALIQPSNEMFYENRLVVFPSPSREQNGRKIGLVFHHHPETVYEPGATRRYNKPEAALVADAVVRHVTEHPELSLMVAAMNKPQADLIYDEVSKRERLQPEIFQRYRELNPHEPLEIKNLENVQGDERDVVFISVTYGRDSSGVIRQQFGPLLRDGGERRLNVLITRARQRCEVFSNLTADDIRVEAGRRGLQSLKRYLRFAETGEIDVAQATGMLEESPFEEEVSRALRDHGYEVDCQVGSEGYRIDMAVRDPEAPGRYLLGIECDGATYHSARSARDRDKLREQVLRSRGWRLHRIWSSDWWQDRDGEIARLLAALEDSADESPVEEEEVDESFVEEQAAVARRAAKPYQAAPNPGLLFSDEQLLGYAVAVVRQEGPIGHELLLLRLRDALGEPRMTRGVRQRIEALIQTAVRQGLALVVGDAYQASPDQRSSYRDWSTRPADERKAVFVTDVELQAAVLDVVRASYGAEIDACVRAAFGALGFKRVSEEAAQRGHALVRRLITEGLVQWEAGMLRMAQP